MTLSWEEFQTAYTKAPPAVQAIIDSEQISQTIEKIAASNLYDDSALGIFVLLLSRVVLGVISDTNTLSQYLNGVVEPEKISGAANLIFTEAKTLLAAASNNTTIATDIAETEAALEQLAPMRTMAGDMHTLQGDEAVYQSSQDQLLARAPQPAPPPPAPGPRWESQQ